MSDQNISNSEESIGDEESGSLEERLNSEGIASKHPSGDFTGGLVASEEGIGEGSEEPFFIVRSDSDSVKQIIHMLSSTSQPMLSIDKALRTSSLLSKLIWGGILFGIGLVLYQNIIYTQSTYSTVAPMNIFGVLLISAGMVITVSRLDSYVTRGLLNSLFDEKKSRSFSSSILGSLVGLVLWVVGLLTAVKPLSLSLTGSAFVKTNEIADGLSQITADQALAILPLTIYSVGALVGIVYVVQAFIGVRTISKNSVKTENFADVMKSKYIRIMSQD